jgi:hypothetical protein
MKKTVVAVIALASILIIIGAMWLSTNHVPGQAEEQIDEAEVTKVEVTKFMWAGFFGMGPGYPWWETDFNVTLCNSGTRNLTGLSVEIKLFANGTQLGAQAWFDQRLDLLAGETREFSGRLFKRLDEPNADEVLVIVLLNNTVLDEFRVP